MNNRWRAVRGSGALLVWSQRKCLGKEYALIHGGLYRSNPNLNQKPKSAKLISKHSGNEKVSIAITAAE